MPFIRITTESIVPTEWLSQVTTRAAKGLTSQGSSVDVLYRCTSCTAGIFGEVKFC